MMNPKSVSVAPPASTADTVVQQASWVSIKEKREALRHLINSEDVTNAVIFCNRKRDCGVLHRSLVRHNFDAVVLHGDMSQPARMETLQKFKDGEARLLVASDVAARGLDIAGLSHVFNFDLPTNPEDYVHRIGRTGRAGKDGRAFFGDPEDAKYLAAIEKLIGKSIPAHEIGGLTLGTSDIEAAGEDARAGRKRRGRGRKDDRPKEFRRRDIG